MMRRPKIEEIFTTRDWDINASMYIDRPELESELKEALRGSLHVAVHGVSGGGKTWLYRKVLTEMGARISMVNGANASRLGSITRAIERALAEQIPRQKVAESETKKAEIDAVVAKGGVEHTDEYRVPDRDPLLSYLSLLRTAAGEGNICVLVLDNLERIFTNEGLMRELGDIVVLLDDASYAKHRIKLLLVGVPHELRKYYQLSADQATVANRLYEIPEVSGLSQKQVFEFVRRGFIEQLKIQFRPEDLLDHLQRRTFEVTMGIPQRMQELCASVAHFLERNQWQPSSEAILAGEVRWLGRSLMNVFTKIDDFIHVADSTKQQRMQILFALGRIRQELFLGDDVLRILRLEFSHTSWEAAVVKDFLAAMTKGNEPIIHQVKGDRFCFSDPRVLMCIKIILRKNPDQTVVCADRSEVDKLAKSS